MLFAWHALGAAFGPMVLLFIANVRIRRTPALISLWLGFGLTVVFNWMPNTPGDIVERVVPFLVAFAVAWLGRERAVTDV